LLVLRSLGKRLSGGEQVTDVQNGWLAGDRAGAFGPPPPAVGSSELVHGRGGSKQHLILRQVQCVRHKETS
jgi:hypothetical protein